MPAFTKVQLVMLEIVAAFAAIGRVAERPWGPVAYVVSAAVLMLAAVPLRRRWLYQVLVSWLGMRRRRRGMRASSGIDAVVGPLQIVTLTGSGGSRFAAIRTGTIWAVPVEVRLDGVFNDDATVPISALASLLTIEDVPVSSVRLLTIAVPAIPAPSAPPGPGPAPARAAARYCVLTLDTITASAAVAARGGSDAAVTQILRRFLLRAEEVLGNARLSVRALDEAGVRRLLDACLLGPLDGPEPATGSAREHWSGIEVAGTRSATVALGGSAADALDKLATLTAALPAALSAAALVLRRPAPDRAPVGTLLLRLTAPSGQPAGSASELARLAQDAARRAGLSAQRLDGEQASLLRATLPVGLAAAAL